MGVKPSPKNVSRTKIKVTGECLDIFPRYRPKVGKVYDAEYSPATKSREVAYSGKGEFAVIDILDKRIVLRRGEFEIVGG